MHYDIIVIGTGSMGSAACFFLAQRGARVLGLEQFSISHDRGSHAGQSRIIRKAYYEHPDYVPLLERAYQHWHNLESLTITQFYFKTGVVYFGRPADQTMQGIRKSSELYKVPVDVLSDESRREDFFMFNVPSDYEALLESDAGFVRPERTVLAYTALAREHGATISSETKVIHWKDEESKIKVVTDRGTFTSDKLIITAGAWTSQLLPQLKLNLKVTRQMLAWVKPENPELFSLGKLPCWFITDPGRGIFYGFPMLPENKFEGPIGFKIAHHHPGAPWDPDDASTIVPAGAEENIRYALKNFFPAVGDNIIAMKRCLYTYTDDENFVIDHLPGSDSRVTIACGFSGHGFKFVPVVGEVLADLAMNGRTTLPIDFLRLDRFSTVKQR